MVVRISLSQAALSVNAAGEPHERIVALNFGSQIIVGGGGGMTAVSWSDIKDRPSFSAVATSGRYDDLSGRPVFSTVATSGRYADLIGRPTDDKGYGRARSILNHNSPSVDVSLWVGSSDEYDALDSVDTSTLYFVV